MYHARLAYEPDTDVLRHRLALCGMQLIQHNKAWRFGSPNGLGALFWCCGEEINTGRVANYLAIEPRERLAVLAVKGTSTIEDALTDIIADTGPLHWPKVAKVAGALASAHSGFRLASYGVLHQTEAVLHHFLRPLNYRLVLMGPQPRGGHGLLLGQAALRQARPPFRCRGPDFRETFGGFRTTQRPEKARKGAVRLCFNAPQLLKCYAYATPPCLDRGTALAMASYTTSVVHHDDFVVRASLYNAKLMVHAWREAKKLMDDDEFEAREALDASILVRN